MLSGLERRASAPGPTGLGRQLLPSAGYSTRGCCALDWCRRIYDKRFGRVYLRGFKGYLRSPDSRQVISIPRVNVFLYILHPIVTDSDCLILPFILQVLIV